MASAEGAPCQTSQTGLVHQACIIEEGCSPQARWQWTEVQIQKISYFKVSLYKWLNFWIRQLRDLCNLFFLIDFKCYDYVINIYLIRTLVQSFNGNLSVQHKKKVFSIILPCFQIVVHTYAYIFLLFLYSYIIKSNQLY